MYLRLDDDLDLCTTSKTLELPWHLVHEGVAWCGVDVEHGQSFRRDVLPYMRRTWEGGYQSHVVCKSCREAMRSRPIVWATT